LDNLNLPKTLPIEIANIHNGRVTKAVDTWLAIYEERAADDEMCIYCLGVNIYFSFRFFLYFSHYSL